MTYMYIMMKEGDIASVITIIIQTYTMTVVYVIKDAVLCWYVSLTNKMMSLELVGLTRPRSALTVTNVTNMTVSAPVIGTNYSVETYINHIKYVFY